MRKFERAANNRKNFSFLFEREPVFAFLEILAQHPCWRGSTSFGWAQTASPSVPTDTRRKDLFVFTANNCTCHCQTKYVSNCKNNPKVTRDKSSFFGELDLSNSNWSCAHRAVFLCHMAFRSENEKSRWSRLHEGQIHDFAFVRLLVARLFEKHVDSPE